MKRFLCYSFITGNAVRENIYKKSLLCYTALYRKRFAGNLLQVALPSRKEGCFMNRLKQIRESLGVSQEGLARRTRSITTRTVRNAEDGNRVTNDTATQIVDALNGLLAENGRPEITLNDLGLTLY